MGNGLEGAWSTYSRIGQGAWPLWYFRDPTPARAVDMEGRGWIRVRGKGREPIDVCLLLLFRKKPIGQRNCPSPNTLPYFFPSWDPGLMSGEDLALPGEMRVRGGKGKELWVQVSARLG